MEQQKHLKALCLFGPALVECRKKVGMSQSRLSIEAAINATQLRTIEKGLSQPGVEAGVRLVAALGDSVGEFFQSLITSAGLSTGHEKGIQTRIFFNSERSMGDIWANLDPASTRIAFGPAFKAVRLHYMVTQKAVAEKAQYNLRNLLDVEAGRQEPGIMTALAMVCAVGADVGEFFEAYSTTKKTFSAR